MDPETIASIFEVPREALGIKDLTVLGKNSCTAIYKRSDGKVVLKTTSYWRGMDLEFDNRGHLQAHPAEVTNTYYNRQIHTPVINNPASLVRPMEI